MDFFFWGYIKDIMQSERVEFLPNLHLRITVAVIVVHCGSALLGVG
jgi:hypothetical protein